MSSRGASWRVVVPKWIHSRAEHLLAKNPSMSKATAFAVEALEGELLGDGSLLIGKRYKNAKFQLQAKARGQVLLAHAALHVLGGEPTSFIRKSSGYRTTPTRMWQWASHRHEFLTVERQRWYPSGTKIVPPDFRLSPLAALHWFVGDGSLHPTQAKVTLCTDNFDELSVKRLCQQLVRLGFSPYLSTTSKGHQRINLSGWDCDTWFDVVGPCVVSEMAHKWSVVKRKYSTKRVSAQEKERVLFFRAQGLFYSEIARKVGRNISTVWEAVNGRNRRASLDPR